MLISISAATRRLKVPHHMETYHAVTRARIKVTRKNGRVYFERRDLIKVRAQLAPLARMQGE